VHVGGLGSAHVLSSARVSDLPEPRLVPTATITQAVLEDGPPDGPLALLLHGFPDTAATWRHLMPLLASDGYHVVAPYLRGYGPTEVPSDGCYQTGALVADALALHAALGGDSRAVVVGHDWGAMAAYGAAAFAPSSFRRVVGMAVPPFGALLGGIFTYAQLKRSFYIFFFQSPLADGVVAADDLDFVARLWGDWSPGYDASFDLAEVRASLGSPERLSAAIGYYRAMLDPSLQSPALASEQAAVAMPVPQPTLYVHGLDDGALGAELVGEHVLSFLGAGSELMTVEGAGHFVHLEQPDEVNARVRAFLAG
jgi:pimeloyl-ACP methyl ester carboxylesterase